MAFVYWYIRDFFLFCGRIIKLVFYLLGALIDLLIKAVQFLTSVIGALPTVLTVGAVALVVVCVLYKVLGRESAG